MFAPSNRSISANAGSGASSPAMSASNAADQACSARRVAMLRGPGKIAYSPSSCRTKSAGVVAVCSRNVATNRLSGGQSAKPRSAPASMRSSDTSS